MNEPKTIVENPTEELHELFRSSGWKYVLIPSLKARQEQLLKRLALDRRMELIEIREIQAQLDLILKFLTPGEERLRYFSFGVTESSD